MSHQSPLIEKDILAYLKEQEHKSLLRFITCGSVDDGKSTLIGRLLYESKLIYEDQLSALEQDSKKVGTQGEDIDFALLVDGLASEREQGITIDVAYRFFSTDKRKFIVADTPGHEQYTRNMATGASTAELAILMVDARYGVVTQTKRHSTIVQLLGVDNIVVAINKMDLVDYDEKIYQSICTDYQHFADQIGLKNVTPIPVSALKGENITEKSQKMPWYSGQSLISFLETVPVKEASQKKTFSMPVQWVNRPNLNFRGFTGQITTGTIAVGDEVEILPSKVTSKVKSLLIFEKNLQSAIAGQSVTLTFNDEVDISRGDVLVAKTNPVKLAQRFLTTLLWMSDTALQPGKTYWVKTRAKLFTAVIQKPKYKLNINTLEKVDTETLSLNEIGQCVCDFDQEIPFEPYQENAHLGSFIIIDRSSNNTVAMGLIESESAQQSWAESHAEEREKYWSKGLVTPSDRSERTKHQPLLLILTGAKTKEQYAQFGIQLEKDLFDQGLQIYRYGFQFLKGLGTDASSIADFRQEMIQQLLDIAYAFLDAGFVFITSISHLTIKEKQSLKALTHPFQLRVINLDKNNKTADLSCTDPAKLIIDLKKEKLIENKTEIK